MTNEQTLREEIAALQAAHAATRLGLGLLVRHLHVDRLIDAAQLAHHHDLLARNFDQKDAHEAQIATALAAMAAAFRRDLPTWNSDRANSDLFRSAGGPV